MDVRARVIGRLDLAAYAAGLRPTDQLTLPRFLGIGAQKAGTTWLHENLSRHPDLFLPPAKELHHFDWFRQGTLRRYARQFEGAGQRAAGEITPGYSALRGRRVQLIGKILGPDARILVLLRDPVDRAWSQVRMDVRQRGGSVDELTDEQVLRHLSRRGARRRGEYVAMLDAWEAAFPGRVWVGFYEDVSTRPNDLLRDVFAFLGVRTDVDLSDFPVRESFNPGGAVSIPEGVRQALVAQYRTDLQTLRGRFGERISAWARTEV